MELLHPLHSDPEQAAKWHCDRHVVEQIERLAYLVADVARGKGAGRPYMYNRLSGYHPQVVEWAAESKANFRYCYELACYLETEIESRLGARHEVYSQQLEKMEPDAIPFEEEEWSDPPRLHWSQQLRVDDVHRWFRLRYIYHDRSQKQWTGKEVPEWYTGKVSSYHD